MIWTNNFANDNIHLFYFEILKEIKAFVNLCIKYSYRSPISDLGSFRLLSTTPTVYVCKLPPNLNKDISYQELCVSSDGKALAHRRIRHTVFLHSLTLQII